MISLSVEMCDIVNDFLIIKWNDEKESYISLKALRDACPCAECSGETDVLGNFYPGYGQPKGESGYRILEVKPVGHYALQPFWEDGHNTGIYRFGLLRELGDRQSKT